MGGTNSPRPILGQRLQVLLRTPDGVCVRGGAAGGCGWGPDGTRRIAVGSGKQRCAVRGAALKAAGTSRSVPGPPEVCRDHPKCAGITRSVPGPPEVPPGRADVCRDRPKCRRGRPKCRRDEPKCSGSTRSAAGIARIAAGTSRSVPGRAEVCRNEPKCAGTARSVPGSHEVPPEPPEVCRDRTKCRRNDPKCRRDDPKCRRNDPNCYGTTRTVPGSPEVPPGRAEAAPGSPEVSPERAEVLPEPPEVCRDRPKCRRDRPKCAGTSRSVPERAEVPAAARGDPRSCHVGRAVLGAGAAGAARRCGAAYCDAVEPVVLPSEGGFVKYESSKAGKRLQRSEGSFQRNAPSSDVLLTLDVSTRFQRVKGFGGSLSDAAALNILGLPQPAQEMLLRSYFSDSGQC
ncbi:uncharacterized protein LOC116237342 [Phasianus colchicus]|uniref:uncharacterized protein LOC116237342 n=1 Tax=Phasianus colchicus TaxID=9054 RepID=UPI00129E9C67|nr:uncharacterized protein LOC116237342 [Phasianus colchicus]